MDLRGDCAAGQPSASAKGDVMKTRIWLCALLCVTCAVTLAWAIGVDIPPGQKVDNPAVSISGKARAPIWPAGLSDLANSRLSVHGYDINGGIYLFYAGDTSAFNEFVKRYASVSGMTHEVVLYVGPKNARSPWDKADRNIGVNWGFLVPDVMTIVDLAPLPTHIDLWLGGDIDLAKFATPKSVSVRSGGDIEKLVADHAKAAK